MTHSDGSCPVCGTTARRPLARFTEQPVLIGALWDTRDAALGCKKGDISLNVCERCTLVWNEAFDPNLVEYNQRYDNSLHFSTTFQRYSEGLVARLVSTYDLNGKTIVDIGCGKGDFLRAVCAAGSNRGFGFDPSYEDVRDPLDASENITFVKEYYGDAHADVDADLITSRFVLEHIPRPVQFLQMIRRSIRKPADTTVFCEVPNIDLIVRQGSVWDIIYEHCIYFSAPSLSRAFEAAGFQPFRVNGTFANQYLTIDAGCAEVDKHASSKSETIDELLQECATFAETNAAHRARWDARLEEYKQSGRSVVAWGAGAKAVGFLNMLDNTEVVRKVVDINPHKSGKFLPGSGHEVIPLEGLRDVKPDCVIIMNPIYRDEIGRSLSEMGLHPELADV